MARHVFPVVSPSVGPFDPGPDPALRRSLDRLLLGRARRLLRDVVWFEASPTRVIRLGRDGVDLPTALPGTLVRASTLASAPTWRGWPDLVWCDHLLSAPGAEIPLGTTLDRLADAVPRGSVVALVDTHPSTPAPIVRALELHPVGDPRPGLRARFTALHDAMVVDRDGVRALLFVGRR
jgi:hypothetical protein